jgi:septum formation protein
MQQLVLASSSKFRQSLLQRLELPFEVAVPDIDEAVIPGESPGETALRLARAKAVTTATGYLDALVIGSDQVAVCDGMQVGKPGTYENAFRQLRMMRGKTIEFLTAVCLLNTRTGAAQAALASNTVTFRDLGDDEIVRYLQREQPYQCTGSAKSEGLGIALISRMQGDDPNALIGLPLIELVRMLRHEGVLVP